MNKPKNYIFVQQKNLEQCKKIIDKAYEEYRNSRWEKAHYSDAEFFDILEKNHLITSFYTGVFNEAYEKFLENQTQSEFLKKLEKIRNFLFGMSRTLKKII